MPGPRLVQNGTGLCLFRNDIALTTDCLVKYLLQAQLEVQ